MSNGQENRSSTCAYCDGALWAITTVQVCHPYPVDKMNKQTLKRGDVSITGAELTTARPFCTNPECASAGQPETPPRSRTELIQDLMRELINRGMSPLQLQKLVDGHVCAIDMLAATYPKAVEADEDSL